MISRALIDEIMAQAAESPEHEICGLLLGEGTHVAGIRACANVAVDRRDSFEIDPAALIAIHRQARAGGPAPIGHYHSHPQGRAEPSPRDAAAAEPGGFWIIVAGGDLGCWRAVAGGAVLDMFEPVTLALADSTAG